MILTGYDMLITRYLNNTLLTQVPYSWAREHAATCNNTSNNHAVLHAMTQAILAVLQPQ